MSSSVNLNHVENNGYDYVAEINKKKINMIVAKTPKNGIGMNGSIPWRLREDLKRFRTLTTNNDSGKINAVVMGRKTFESLPNGPLKGRINCVLTRNAKDHYINCDSVYKFDDYEKCIHFLEIMDSVGDIWIIGGASIYEAALKSTHKVSRIYTTEVYTDVECDTFFPEFEVLEKVCDIDDVGFIKCYDQQDKMDDYHIKSENDLKYRYIMYANVQMLSGEGLSVLANGEKHYHELLQRAIDEGEIRETRNGDVHSIFGAHLRFDLRLGFPLLTTKRVYWKGIVEELLWFIRGDTNANRLDEKKVKIWNGNTNREYLDSIGLTDYPVGCGGPIYGFQWRHFNASYKGMDADHTGEGIDQLAECIRLIREEPTSRRIFMSAWNPCQLKEMALPPCHVSYQFYVSNGRLSCQMYQRSADLFLGLPFNIASTALLTTMIAKTCDLDVGEVMVCIGDVHVYAAHLIQVMEQLSRPCARTFPVVNIKTKKEIDEYESTDIELLGYNPMSAIKADML